MDIELHYFTLKLLTICDDTKESQFYLNPSEHLLIYSLLFNCNSLLDFLKMIILDSRYVVQLCPVYINYRDYIHHGVLGGGA